MSENEALPAGQVRASDAERDAVVARLNTACGEGRLTLEEFNDRVERVYAATMRADLDGLLTDLPAPSPSGGRPAARTGSSPARPSWRVSPIGGYSASGSWRVPERTISVSVIGGADLDLREAELDAPVVEITQVSVIGGVSLRVPAGVRVEVSGFHLIGCRTVDATSRLSPDAPTVRLRAFSIIGGVNIRRS
ncbi:MAG: DUF1707 SHOCT-like domain-containing protein [Mycobacteriales bacterium]|nr:MAG: hypothetical protein DLM56_03745 [Pseudonocardiales bacterium]